MILAITNMKFIHLYLQYSNMLTFLTKNESTLKRIVTQRKPSDDGNEFQSLTNDDVLFPGYPLVCYAQEYLMQLVMLS